MRSVGNASSVSLVLLLLGCNGGDGAGGEGDIEVECGDVLANADEEGKITIALRDAENYAFQSSIQALTTRVQANSDILFDWSEVTQDMLGRELDATAGVGMLEVLLWRYDPDEFLRDINEDTLDLTKFVALAYCDNTVNASSSCRFLELLSPMGTALEEETLVEYVDPEMYAPSDHTYVAMLAEGSKFGHGTLMVTFFELDASESNQEIRITNASTTLDYAADLMSLTPISIPSTHGSVILDWGDSSQLTTNAMGADWIPTRITDVMVAHFQDLTVSNLEEQFLDLESLADELYTARITAGQEVELGLLTDADGVAFPGIDDTGVWIVSLSCSSCYNPAPWFLSLLSPCD